MAEDRNKPPLGGRAPARGNEDVTAPVDISDAPETLDLDDLDDIFAEVDALDATGVGDDAPAPEPLPEPPAASPPARSRVATAPPPLPAAGGWEEQAAVDVDPDMNDAMMAFPPPGRRPATLPPVDVDMQARAAEAQSSAPQAPMFLEESAPIDRQDPASIFDEPVLEDSGPRVAAATPRPEPVAPVAPREPEPMPPEPMTTPEPIAAAAEPEPEPERMRRPSRPAPIAPSAVGTQPGAATRARLGRRTAPPAAFDEPREEPPLEEVAAAPVPAPAPSRSPSLSTPPPMQAVRGDSEEPTLMNDHGLFRQEVNRLARNRDWQKLAAVTSAALEEATWAKLPETRAALLEDLARIYRDRLKDPSSAEDVFVRLAKEDPANPSAMEHLRERYGERGDWRAVYDLLAAAIERTWDPDQRLRWTRESVEIAQEKLGMADLVVDAWERLERLGDAADETRRALSETYRKTARWDKLAEFLARRADKLQGPERVVALREVAEAYLSGLRDQVKATEVLEQILALRADDPIALLALARVLARRKEWEKLASLGERPLAGGSKSATLDFRRLIADALWTAGELERAYAAHKRVLELDADDIDALKAEEAYFTRTEKWAALVDFLQMRAEKAAGEEQRLELLARAARLAEKQLGAPGRAVALWEAHAAVPAGRLEAYQALTELYQTQGDDAGVARSLEGQLAIVRERHARIELLRRLGGHAARRMNDDKRAEECWKEIVALAPDDKGATDELLALQRRRGDFEGLDATLTIQGWRAGDDGSAQPIWLDAAHNVEENIKDAERARRAWWRVVDLAPHNRDALGALVRHRAATGGAADAVYALEDQLRAAGDGAERVALAHDVARLCEETGDRAGALAAYERVLRWAPTDAAALAGLRRLWGDKGAGVIAGALDVAGAHTDEQAGKLALGEQLLSLVPDDDKLGRFFGLRRLLWLSGRDPRRLAELAEAAAGPGAWSDLASVYHLLAGDADGEERAALAAKLAEVYEQRLGDSGRAFLALQHVGQAPDDVAPRLAELGRLAEATGRHEDHLALHDVSARHEAAADARRAALRRRAAICEEKLNDKERAFHEQMRVLALDPHDAEALSEARRLAAARSLWRQLDALYAELWDRAPGTAERIALARARQNVHSLRLESPQGALDQLLVIYRLDPEQPEILDQLLAAADELGAWERVLPLYEARLRAAGELANPDELARVASLQEQKRKDQARALALYAEAFVLRPDSDELCGHVERLAEATGRQETLAQLYRLAAARTGDGARRLALTRKIAALGAGPLGKPIMALEAHQRILQLDGKEMASLEVVIAHLRQAGRARELREALGRWSELAPDAPQAQRIERLLEMATLSQGQLADPEAALGTYAQILELDPANEAALEGVKSLTEGTADPALEARRLKLQLARASGEARVELQLALAKLQEEEFEEIPAAVATLRELVAEAGPAGPGFAPLARLLERDKRWPELCDLHEARAEALGDGAAKAAALLEIIGLAELHPEPSPDGETRMERLCRKLLEARPDHVETRKRLEALLRGGGRHQDLATLIEAQLGALDEEAPDRRDLELELARLYDRALDRLADAERVLAKVAARDPEDGQALLPWLASLRLRQGDHKKYLDLRTKQARELGGAAGALILCHLAEAASEKGEQSKLVADLYREARTMDGKCEPAVEALKAIGRRSKNWRGTAALLPDPDEEKLDWSERAARLRQRGDSLADGTPGDAQGWYLRAVAVDPDHYPAWDALARVAMALDDDTARLGAEAATLAAYERAEAPRPDRLREHAERLGRLAEARAGAGDTADAARLWRRAYELCPTFPAAALAVADQRLEAGDLAGAHGIYDRVLRQTGEALADAERLHATYQRGALATKLGRAEDAITDLREALRIDPLHSGALNALADTLALKGRTAAAVQHYTQALLVSADAPHRGLLYARLGRLWEDSLENPDEAAVCYDRALAVVEDDRDLLRRGLRLYQRQGRGEPALAVIEKLLPAATEPRELAELWTAQGDILSSRDQEKAIEAYDMALSYDPGAPGALNGLAKLLEARGEWAQLLDIFEARTESGTPEERAHALRHLARIASEKLGDPARSEKYLKQAIELAAVAEDYEKLLAIYGDDPRRADERRAVVAGLLATSGPWMDRLGDLGRELAQSDRRLAWCLLSPMAGLSIPDAQLKGLVLELRRELEKADNLDLLTQGTHRRVRHHALDPELMEVFTEIDEAITLGPQSPDDVGAQGASKADQRTALGKTFAGLAERLGLDGATLWRAQGLPGAPIRVLDADGPQVVVRSELLQLLPIPEINLLFTTMLELCRPGARLLGALSAEELRALVPAVLAAAPGGEAPADPTVAALAEKLRAADEATRIGWADRLRGHSLVVADAPGVGPRLLGAVEETARRVGLIAVPDLRTAARLMTRLDESLAKMPTGGPLGEMDAFIAAVDPLKALIGFAASADFARALGVTA